MIVNNLLPVINDMGSCIIIGAGPGLGAAIARRFASGGFAVGLVARDRARLQALAEQCQDHGVDVASRSADAADPAGLAAAIAGLEAETGPCSALIYNAAVLAPRAPLALDVETIRRELDVNVIGALVAAQRVAPGMVARGEGAIIFTGGGLALEPYPEWTSLALGKAALRNLSFSLYKELAPRGVHVAVVAVCGIVEAGGPFDPDRIAAEYWRLATAPRGLIDREFIYRPPGTDRFYNDPARKHVATTPALSDKEPFAEAATHG